MLGDELLTGCGKAPEFSKHGRSAGTPWMPGKGRAWRSHFISIACVMAGLVPAIHALAEIPLIGQHSVFFRALQSIGIGNRY
jgi:hypothetical protein